MKWNKKNQAIKIRRIKAEASVLRSKLKDKKIKSNK